MTGPARANSVDHAHRPMMQRFTDDFTCRLLPTILLACQISAIHIVPSSAQQYSHEQRQRTIDWFVNEYYYPKALCAFAAPQERNRLDQLIASIRQDHARAFELAETSPEYRATVAELQPKIAGRFADRSAQGQASFECRKLTEQLAAKYKKRRYDALFDYLIKRFSPQP